MAEFLHMGGYAFFVWTSYGIVAVALIYAFLAPLVYHRRLVKELARTTLAAGDRKVTATQTSTGSTADH